MKSRWTTCLLLAAVAAVWGVVAWKIFAPAGDAVPAARPKPAQVSAALPAADSLRLDYPDPFLKGAPRRERVKIAHLGTITSAGSPLYILTVGDTQYELTRGDSAGRFALTACDGDSLYLCKDGVTYGVKRCGP